MPADLRLYRHHSSIYKTVLTKTVALHFTYNLNTVHHTWSQYPNATWLSLYCTHLYCAVTAAFSLTNTVRIECQFLGLGLRTSVSFHCLYHRYHTVEGIHRPSAAEHGSQSCRREFLCCCAHHVTWWNVMGVIVKVVFNAPERTVFCS
jgi:hypothetical protein